MPQLVSEDEVKAVTAKVTNFRWVIAFLLFVVYTVAAADRANLGMALPFIRKEFAMSNTEAGALASLFLLAYAIAQIPSGFIYSRFGVRSIFSFAMVATSAATGLIGTASSVFMLKAYRFLLGLAEGPLPLGITSTINHWFPPKEKGTATGIFLSAAKFGPVLVPPLCAWILVAYGWREIFYIFALPGIVLSVVWYVLVRESAIRKSVLLGGGTQVYRRHRPRKVGGSGAISAQEIRALYGWINLPSQESKTAGNQ